MRLQAEHDIKDTSKGSRSMSRAETEIPQVSLYRILPLSPRTRDELL